MRQKKLNDTIILKFLQNMHAFVTKYKEPCKITNTTFLLIKELLLLNSQVVNVALTVYNLSFLKSFHTVKVKAEKPKHVRTLMSDILVILIKCYLFSVSAI